MQHTRILICSLIIIAALLIVPASAADDDESGGGILEGIVDWIMRWLFPGDSVSPEPAAVSSAIDDSETMKILAQDIPPGEDLPPGEPSPDPTPTPASPAVIGTVFAVDYRTVPPYGSAPLMVRFTSVDTVDTVAIDTCAWNFGDGFSSTERDHFHSYESAGTYTAALTVSNTSTGWNTTAEITITVEPPGAVPLPARDEEMP